MQQHRVPKFLKQFDILTTSAFCLALTLSPFARSNEGAAAEGHAAEAENIGIAQPQFEASKSFAPAKPKLVGPAPMATVSGQVTLKWEAVDSASDYHVQVATDPNFKWLVSEDHFVKGTEFNFAAEAGKTYWWRVAARKADNKATHSKSFFASSTFTAK